MITCCPLSKVPDVGATLQPQSMLTLLSGGMTVDPPASVKPGQWLFVGVNDINTANPGLKLAEAGDIEAILAFLNKWDEASPLLIHCWAGISRSTACTFIAGCLLRPKLSEQELAWRLRFASPSATPNHRLVALADQALGRAGRMVAAIDEIGRGTDAFEGNVFQLDLD